MAEKNPDELGALWIKTSAKGEYMTGTIEGIGGVVVFRNDRKKPGDKTPDWRILKAKPREERPASAPPEFNEPW